MAAQIFSNAKLWVAGFDWSGDVNELALKLGAEAKDNTPGRRHAHARPGLMNFSFAHKGFWNGGVEQRRRRDLQQRVRGRQHGDEPGRPGLRRRRRVAYTGQMIAGSYEPGAKIGDMLAFGISGDGDGPLVRGTLMKNATVTTTGNGTVFQLGAVPAGQKMYAALHVLQGVAGTSPTLDLKLQSAALVGFGSPTDRITFTQKTSSGALWGTPVAGSITDQFWRFTWTIGGTAGPSFPIVAIAGFR
jgi:hypothetical protein